MGCKRLTSQCPLSPAPVSTTHAVVVFFPGIGLAPSTYEGIGAAIQVRWGLMDKSGDGDTPTTGAGRRAC
jgi:hypothetical protein